MKITVNGSPQDVAAKTLAGLLDELGYGTDKVATAIDENFVPATARQDMALEPGCRVEIVAPRQGG